MEQWTSARWAHSPERLQLPACILFAEDAEDKLRLGVVIEIWDSICTGYFAEGVRMTHLSGDGAAVSLDAADEKVEALASSDDGGTLVATFLSCVAMMQSSVSIPGTGFRW